MMRTRHIPTFVRQHTILIGLACIALLARLAVAPFAGYQYDVRAFTEWTAYLAHNPLRSFYTANLHTPPDHLPGDLMIFAGLGRVATAFFPGFNFTSWYAEVAVRSVPIASDVALGLLVYAFTRRRASERISLVAASLVFFNPALFMVSAIWGQWDSFAALLLTVLIILALRDHSILVWPLLTYITLVKPQFALFGLLILLLFIRNATSERSLLKPRGLKLVRDLAVAAPICAIIFAVICLPFGVGFPFQTNLRWTILDRIQFAVDRYNYVSLGAHNIWPPLGLGFGDADNGVLFFHVTYFAFGMLSLITALIGTVLFTMRANPKGWALWAGCYLSAMSIYLFPTRVHERYMLPAIVFLLILWPTTRRLLPILILLSLSYVASLTMAMSNGVWLASPYTDSILSIVNISLFVWSAGELVRASGEYRLPRRSVPAIRSAEAT